MSHESCHSGFLPARPPESHKGEFGRALLIGGARGMAGAIALSGMACLRSGVGLVSLAVANAAADVVAGFEPSYMTVPLADDRLGRIADAAWPKIWRLAQQATVVAIGPGLGQSVALRRMTQRLFHDLPEPMVIDADGLNALKGSGDLLKKHAGLRVLTPHPREFQRLTQLPATLSRAEWEAEAIQFAARTGMLIVLKGHRSLITDGQRAIYNQTGNPGMATGGSGDVLTGVITGFLAIGLEPFDAVEQACRVHGLAGDMAAETLGETAMIASDLIRFLPQAIGPPID